MEDIFNEVPLENDKENLCITEKRECKVSEVGHAVLYGTLEK